jgi:hypothetical protein
MRPQEILDRIRMLEHNKEINKKLYQEGKRDYETYLICRNDAQSAINRLNHEAKQ